MLKPKIKALLREYATLARQLRRAEKRTQETIARASVIREKLQRLERELYKAGMRP